MIFQKHWLMAIAMLLFPVLVLAADPAPPQDSPMWQKLRISLFQDRPIRDSADDLIELTAPARAEDPAVVPIAIQAKIAQTPDRYIKTIYLILDENPGPLAAVFHLTQQSGRASIQTRVRVEAYTYLRAVVETNDGALSMSTTYVKASGGCSAPANRDASQPFANLGKMKLRIQDNPELNRPVMAQLMIRHPNQSGLVMDQATRLYQPPHFVRKVQVSYAGKPVLTADVDFAISENPNFRFYFTPNAAGQLVATAEDSEDMHFQTSLDVKPD